MLPLTRVRMACVHSRATAREADMLGAPRSSVASLRSSGATPQRARLRKQAIFNLETGVYRRLTRTNRQGSQGGAPEPMNFALTGGDREDHGAKTRLGQVTS